jgi:hypothetical protein
VSQVYRDCRMLVCEQKQQLYRAILYHGAAIYITDMPRGRNLPKYIMLQKVERYISIVPTEDRISVLQ